MLLPSSAWTIMIPLHLVTHESFPNFQTKSIIISSFLTHFLQPLVRFAVSNMCDYLINVSLLRDFTSKHHGDQQGQGGRERVCVDHQGILS